MSMGGHLATAFPNTSIPPLTEALAEPTITSPTAFPDCILCIEKEGYDVVINWTLVIESLRLSHPFSQTYLKKYVYQRLGKLSYDWKVSLIVPIPKSSKTWWSIQLQANFLASYMYIEQYPGKITIYSLICEHLDEWNFLNAEWDFRIESQPLNFSCPSMSSVFFDLQKTFDRVSHSRLLWKLKQVN